MIPVLQQIDNLVDFDDGWFLGNDAQNDGIRVGVVYTVSCDESFHRYAQGGHLHP